MKEMWKDIPGYEGAYQASSLGRIRSLPREVLSTHKHKKEPITRKYRGKVLSTKPKGCGHLNVSLGANNTQLVHRLILLAFVGVPGAGQECLHRDGNPANNVLENLHWGSRIENRSDMRKHAQQYERRQGSTWLSEEQIRAIKTDLKATPKVTQKELAKKYGVHINTINNINRGFTHKWVKA